MVAVTLTAKFTTSGAFTWTCPPGVTSVQAAVSAGGGGGGAASAVSGSAGGGGGGGEAALEPAVAVTPGLTYAGSVGKGGTSGSFATTPAGGPGADSWFTGDTVTVYAHGGQGGTAGTSATTGGPGGAGGTGSSNAVSAGGGAGDDGTAAANGGGGGSGAGISAAQGWPGNPGNGSAGGAATPGTWPGGAGAAGATTGAAGSTGTALGGAGSGALSTGVTHFGGAGAHGQVFLTWTQNDPVMLQASTAGGVFQYTAPAGATSVTAQAWGAGGGGFNTAAAGPSAGMYRIGATMGVGVYGISDRLQESNTFDGFVGRPMGLQAGKFFVEETGTRSLSHVTDANTPIQVLEMWQNGYIPILCIKANRGYAAGGASDDFTNLQNAMAIWTGAGITTMIIVLWHEPNNGDFASAADYQNYWNHYSPAVAPSLTSTIQLAYNGAYEGGSLRTTCNQYWPGSGVNVPSIYSVDWYGSGYRGNSFLTYPAGNANYPGPADFADTQGVPFGVFEFGAQAGNAALSTLAQWQDFLTNSANGLQTVIAARQARGAPLSHVVYWNGPKLNTITSSTDFRVPALQAFYDALSPGSGGTAAGGAGGGGGEYAAESALAIQDGHAYTLVVGNGTQNAAGIASTVAGQSVTVTAHGGGIAAAVTAGGTGGTGSSNTTHHDGGAGGAGGVASGAGGGGGSSGGTGASGNPGAAGTRTRAGAGGAAVTGGGAGGAGALNGGSGSDGVTPGGGGGASGANGVATGSGADGQITLSSFVTNPGGPGALTLAPLALAGTGSVNVSSFNLAPLAVSATGTVGQFTHIQDSPANQSATGTLTLTFGSPTTAATTLFATLAANNQVAFTAPANWVLDGFQNAGGSTGRIAVWRLPGWANPGGITAVNFTTTATNARGAMAEFSCPAGTTPILDGTSPGTNSGTGPATSLGPASVTSIANGGDLCIAAFENTFSVAPSGTYTLAGLTQIAQQNGTTITWASFWQTGLPTGTKNVTATYSTSTNQTGWAAVSVVYTASPVVTTSGTYAVAPLAFAGTGSAVVPAGTVATSGGVQLAGLGFTSPDRSVTFPGQPLPILVELLINGTWTDISGYVYQRDGITITGRGRPDEASTAQPAQVTLTLNNRDGSFSPSNTAGQFYPFLTRNTQIRISVAAVTAQGANYNVNGTGNGYRFWGEVPSWPVQWDVSGNDVYISVAAAGVLQRLRQSKYSASPVGRYYANIINNGVPGASTGNFGSTGPGSVPALSPAAYWPCEDGGASGSFASGITGGSPMTFTGTPGFASDTSVPGSSAFATLGGSAWTGTPGAFTSGGVTYSTAGTYAWTCPGGVTSVLAECWGAGGGGSSGNTGAGGGGGEYAAATVAVTPGNVYTLVVGTGGSGGPGTTKNTGNHGNGGTKSAFTGDTQTVTAHGGGGGSSGGGGGGGTGTTGITHHNGGGGGGVAGFPSAGSGGGGSGGTSSAGNNGHLPSGNTGGAGGSAVSGGGPGGKGGNGGTSAQSTSGFMPSPGPGGGGGGGGFNTDSGYGKFGGAGFAGQVRLTFGTSTIPAANVLRFILDVPQGGGTNGATMAQIVTSGTVHTLTVSWHSGGNLQLVGKNAGGTTLFDSGSQAFGALGSANTPAPLLVSAQLTQSGGSIGWRLTAITPGAASVVATYKGSITGTLGSVTQVNVNNGTTDTTATGIGHIAVQYALDPITNLAPALAAYAGELAADRFARLCEEQRIPVTVIQAPSTLSAQMGPQPAGLLADLLQDCENADLGQMFERRDAFGLGYVTRAALQNQSPDVTLDYSLSQLAPPLTPTDDDQLTRNDIIATRSNGTVTGTSYETALLTGALSTADPPNGVGLYQYTVSANLFSDTQLNQFVAWLLTLGTVDEFRYPQITVNMMHPSMSDGTFSAMAALDIGGFIVIANPPAWLPPGPINQLAFGFTETLNAFTWTITINAVPEDPYTGNSLPTW